MSIAPSAIRKQEAALIGPEGLSETSASAEIAANLKSAMRRMPAAVALITTRDPELDKPAGLAASAVMPVSIEPPSMRVAVNRNASAHAAIQRSKRYCINLLGTAQVHLVTLFSRSEHRQQRFASADWSYRDGLPYLPLARASIFCDVRAGMVFGPMGYKRSCAISTRAARPCAVANGTSPTSATSSRGRPLPRQASLRRQRHA